MPGFCINVEVLGAPATLNVRMFTSCSVVYLTICGANIELGCLREQKSPDELLGLAKQMLVEALNQSISALQIEAK